MYTLATLLAVASAWTLLRALEDPAKARLWILYGVFATALLYTHNYAIFTVFGQCAFVISVILASWRREGASFLTSKAVRNSSLAFLSIAWAYAPWIPVLLFQKAQVQESYWISEIDWATIPSSWFAIVFPENDYVISDRRAAVALAAISTAMIAIFVRFYDWRRNLVLFHVLIPILCAVVISLTTVSIIVPRHFLLSFIFFLCALAAAIVDAVRGPWRWAAVGCLLAMGIAVNYQYQSFELESDERPGVRGAIAALRKLQAAGEPIVVMHPCIYFSSLYYLNGDGDPKLYFPVDGVTHFTGGPILRGTDFISQSSLSEIKGDSIWVLDTSGFNVARPRYPLPSEWAIQESSRRTFRDVYYFQGDVFLARYVRLRQSAEAAVGRGS